MKDGITVFMETGSFRNVLIRCLHSTVFGCIISVELMCSDGFLVMLVAADFLVKVFFPKK